MSFRITSKVSYALIPSLALALGCQGEESTASRMDHSNMAGMGGMTMAPPRPEPKSLVATPGQPAALLRTDDLDRPAPTSVEDAARAEAINAEMAGMGHHHGTYQHLDAGRDGGSPPASGHEGHQMPNPQPSPNPASPHHHMPPAPAPSPSGGENRR